MSDPERRLAVFPGTFDPITNGHLDVIRRGVRLFDGLVVGVGNNPEKAAMLDQAERAEIIREVLAGSDGVRVETFEGLTVDFARRQGASAILRGIRNTSDLHVEFQIAMTNRAVAGIETVFILTSTQHAFTSSTLIKQMAQMGADVSAMVPPQVLPHLREWCRQHRHDGGLDESP